MCWLDSSAIEQDAGWKPTIELRAGLREMVEWGMKYQDELMHVPQTYTLRA